MRTYSLAALALAFVAFSSCTLNVATSDLNDTDTLAGFQGSYMTTFEILNGSFLPADRAFSPFNKAIQSAASKATAPMWSTTSYSLPTAVGATTNGSLANYPEPGQASSWTVEKMDKANVYLVKVDTTFPADDPRASQAEWYYILSTDGTWTNADPICDPDGVADATHRDKNILTYRDGSIQEEAIVDVTNRFVSFDIEGSLEYPDSFVPTNGDTTSNWSSVVVYTRKYENAPTYSFWSGKQVKTIIGVRYYTEHLVNNNTQLEGSTIVFEKAVTSLASQDGDFLDQTSALYLPDLSSSLEQAYLALSVIRQKILYDYNATTGIPVYSSATRDTRTQTRVVSIKTQEDSYIGIINDEAAALLDAGQTTWIPVGDDPSIINLDSATTVVDKSTMQTYSTTDSTPLSIINDATYGNLGVLYASVTDGEVSATISEDIAGDLLVVNTHGGIATYNGKQGTLLDEVTFEYPNIKGTVQAWVNVDKTTSYPGIVHAGIQSDFSDEIWTLQLLDNNIPAFALVGQTPYEYDMVQSSEKLNLDRWYYLVATWDLGTNSMRFYVNGVLTGSAGFSRIVADDLLTTKSSVVVGSQFYDGTKVLKGYYGLDGKINGVGIDTRVWTTSDILSFYNANKAKTASW